VAATKSALAVVHTLRSLALDDTPLEDIVGRAAYLLERQDTELVATVVLGRLDPRPRRLRVVSGGHPPALVASADGTVRQVMAMGGAIGWPGAGTDGVEELVLAPGDTLLLYTDGLVEARKDIVEGLDSLSRDLASVAALPVATMTDELVRRALAGADRRDDTLALGVRLGDVPVATASHPVPSNHWEIPADPLFRSCGGKRCAGSPTRDWPPATWHWSSRSCSPTRCARPRAASPSSSLSGWTGSTSG
jgi:hypothetical protein